MRIDAHQHFWKYDPVNYSWITDDMAAIRHDFLPDQFLPLLNENTFDGSVVVQCDQSESENNFLLTLAEKNSWIKGIVGWVDLCSNTVEARLAYYQQFAKMKGFRHVLQAETKRDFMLRPDFMRGIQKLESFGFTYDILIYPDQLKFIGDFVKKFPNQSFVIDHLAKPRIAKKEIHEWKKDIEAIAHYENVSCKLSGMVTEAEWASWKKEDFIPYLDTVVNAFGVKRIMFGSDWPVCRVAGSYAHVMEIVTDYFSSFSLPEQLLFFGGNAVKFYKL